MLTAKQVVAPIGEKIDSIDFTFAAVPARTANVTVLWPVVGVRANQHTGVFIDIGIQVHHFAVEFDFRMRGVERCLPGIRKTLLQRDKDFIKFFIVVSPVWSGTARAVIFVGAAIRIPAR